MPSSFLNKLGWDTAQTLSIRESRLLILISAIRVVIFAALILFLDHLLLFGTNPWWLILGATLGIVLAARLSFSRLRFAGYAGVLAVAYFLFRAVLSISEFIPGDSNAALFSAYHLTLHGNLFFLCLSLAALASWFYWHYRHTVTAELLILALSLIYFFAGHREFHFDTPQLVNTLAWSFGVGNLAMLVIIGASSALFLVGYLYLSTLPARPFFGLRKIQSHSSSPRYMGIFSLALIFITLVFGVSKAIFSHYSAISYSRTANGVGQKEGEGLSPLGFHSALGSTNQPAALIRLEGDYSENPYVPMLYLRETALSEFSGRELVHAPAAYDRDVAFGTPSQPYTGVEDVDLLQRIPVVQSIYLLTKHENAFAIDYPLSITQLKNPSPERFTAAFKAYSVAPGIPLSELENHSVGDPRWSEEERAMYLRVHSDSRYAELASKIAEGIENPARKALALTSYLNANAIYTLSPNHAVEPDADPVAPFLFGDMRGYCVHFAHATVYMLRALGIPSRIGTGYLTDLSQARDGHILLRMSDRHAWAEVYFQGAGWMPFDTQPTQVESHADSEVDMKLLEELMGLLGPGEEILPQELVEDESGVEEPTRVYIPSLTDALLLIACLLFALILANSFLFLRWLLPVPLKTRIFWFYAALESVLFNIGYRRLSGETLLEFRKRMLESSSLRQFETPWLVLLQKYNPHAAALSSADLDRARRTDLQELRNFSFLQKLGAFLNPGALFSRMGRRTS